MIYTILVKITLKHYVLYFCVKTIFSIKKLLSILFQRIMEMTCMYLRQYKSGKSLIYATFSSVGLILYGFKNGFCNWGTLFNFGKIWASFYISSKEWVEQVRLYQSIRFNAVERNKQHDVV